MIIISFDCFSMQLRSGNCDSEQEMSVIVQTRQAMIERIKRCLIAYHYHRIDRLKKYRWDYGGILPTNVKVNYYQLYIIIIILCRHVCVKLKLNGFKSIAKILLIINRDLANQVVSI